MTVAVNPPKTPVTEGSKGIAAATLPNVCKMPGPPAPFVPTPLPNIGKSDNSPQGYSTSTMIEGDPVAIKGATFNSIGDVASQGTGGGIVSNNVQGPTSFIGPGSLNVAIEGKPVQLLTDQMLNNGGPGGSPVNAGTTAVMQPGEAPVPDVRAELQVIADECNKKINDDRNKAKGLPAGSKPSGRECTRLGTLKHTCCKEKIDKKNDPSIKAEQPCDMNGAPMKYPGKVRPDVLVTDASGTLKVFDFKFNCKNSPKMSSRQINKYFKAFKVIPEAPIHAW